MGYSRGLDEFDEPDLTALLRDFTYSSNGANPDSKQTFTLQGLQAGTTYELRIYIRSWSLGGAGRQIDFTFSNGDERAYGSSPDGLPEDRPGTILESDNDHEVLFLSYIYTAQSTELAIEALVPNSAEANSGSFHLYALTNQISTGGGGSDFSVTDISHEESGTTLTFSSRPGGIYAIDFSSDLSSWAEVTDSLDSQGDETSFTDTAISPLRSEVYYRVRRAD